MDEIQQTIFALDQLAKEKKEKALKRRDAILKEQRFLRRRANGGKEPIPPLIFFEIIESIKIKTNMRIYPKFNSKKAKNTILYLLSHYEKMSKKKLINLLYFIEFDYYEKHEEALCGFTFIKGKNNLEILELDNLLKELK